MSNQEAKWYPSMYNHHGNVEKLMNLPKKITVFDSTLREGEETPGIKMPPDIKVKIAHKLEELGVTEMEIGYCAYIKAHRDMIKRLKNDGIKAKLGSLIRMWSADYKREIDENVEMGVDILELCGGVSPYQRAIRGFSLGQFMDRMIEATEYARKSNCIVDFYPYDSVRTDMDYLKGLIKAGIEAGADRVHVSDTMGNATPIATRFFVQEIKKVTGAVPVQYHGHNDFGTAVANTCAAVEGGAELVDLVTNGLGDRAGNANLQEVVMTLTCLYGVNTGLKLEKLTDVCKFVAKVTNWHMEENKPIVGNLCFIHESDVHVQAILQGLWNAFEPFLPEVVGQKRQSYFGSTTDRESVEVLAQNLGITLEKKALDEIMVKIKDKIEEKGYATEEEVGEFIKHI
jgi:isopropylmalate/homocitrate/citramalate synthase